MKGRNPQEAVSNFKDVLEKALGCITFERLTVTRVKRYELDEVYSISLKRMSAVPLAGALLTIIAGQRVRVIHDPIGGFRVRTVSYTYEFQTNESAPKEFLLFHWTPEDERAAVRFPHMHIGPALTERQLVIRPGNLHRAHIPTGRISIEKIIWMTIKEFGANPTHGHLEKVLKKSEEEFEKTRTR